MSSATASVVAPFARKLNVNNIKKTHTFNGLITPLLYILTLIIAIYPFIYIFLIANDIFFEYKGTVLFTQSIQGMCIGKTLK
jgi:hypothetical protein